MSLENVVIKDGSLSAITVAGSTDAIVLGGRDFSKSLALFSADTTAQTQRSVELNVRRSKPDPAKPDGHTQDRAILLLREPQEVGDTDVFTVNTGRIEIATSVLRTSAQRLKTRSYLIQLLFSAEMDSFWNNKAP